MHSSVGMEASGRIGTARGFSLVELAIVLAMIATLFTVITLGASYLNSARVQTIIQDVQTLRDAAGRWLERGRLDYAALTVAAMKTEGELPASWGGTNPFGGTYTAGPSATDATRLTVTVPALPPSVGNTLVTYFTGRVTSLTFAAGTLTVTF